MSPPKSIGFFGRTSGMATVEVVAVAFVGKASDQFSADSLAARWVKAEANCSDCHGRAAHASNSFLVMATPE